MASAEVHEQQQTVENTMAASGVDRHDQTFRQRLEDMASKPVESPVEMLSTSGLQLMATEIKQATDPSTIVAVVARWERQKC